MVVLEVLAQLAERLYQSVESVVVVRHLALLPLHLGLEAQLRLEIIVGGGVLERFIL